MSRARQTGALVLVAATMLALGCSNEEAATKKAEPRTLGARPPLHPGIPQPAPAAPADTDDTEGTPPAPTAAPHVMIGYSDAGPLTTMVTIRRDGGAAKSDPDMDVIVSGRSAAAACFTGIKDGSASRSAHIHVIVLPTGSVSRTEVSAGGTTEPWILSCLEGVGDGLHFSEKPRADIRNFSIDVTVTRAH